MFSVTACVEPGEGAPRVSRNVASSSSGLIVAPICSRRGERRLRLPLALFSPPPYGAPKKRDPTEVEEGVEW